MKKNERLHNGRRLVLLSVVFVLAMVGNVHACRLFHRRHRVGLLPPSSTMVMPAIACSSSVAPTHYYPTAYSTTYVPTAQNYYSVPVPTPQSLIPVRTITSPLAP